MAIKVRDYEVRLTRNKEERKQVRQLRYSVFVEEEGAGTTEEQRALGEEPGAHPQARLSCRLGLGDHTHGLRYLRKGTDH